MPDPISIATHGLFSGSGLEAVTGGLFSVDADDSLLQRTTIRRYIVAKLKAAATDAADRVFSERKDSFQSSDYTELPALNVRTRTESADIWAESPRILKNTVEISIVVIDGGEDAEERCERIEKLLRKVIIGPDKYLGQNADDLVYVGSEPRYDSSAAKKFGGVSVNFAATYGEEVSVDPSDQLQRIHNEWNFTKPDAQKEAEDDVLFEET